MVDYTHNMGVPHFEPDRDQGYNVIEALVTICQIVLLLCKGDFLTMFVFLVIQ